MWRQQQQRTYFVVREEGMGWGGKTLMEAYVTDDRRFLSHACLAPKVERDQDGLHLIIKPLWGSSFRRPLGWTLSNPFSFANLFLVEKIQRWEKWREREKCSKHAAAACARKYVQQ